MHVVTVEFVIKADFAELFLTEMLANARASVRDEAGCFQFDVCVDSADPQRIFLYEVYADPATFDAHLKTAHFIAFDRTVAPLVESKIVRHWTRCEEAA